MRIRKRRGPNIERCWEYQLVFPTSSLTITKVKRGPLIPYDLSLYNKPSWHALPKALDKSKKTPPVSSEGQESKLEQITWVIAIIFVYIP